MLRFSLAVLGAAAGFVAALPVLLLAVPFWTVNGLTRLVHAIAARVLPRPVGWQEIMRFEPVVGWKNAPNLDVYVEAGGLCRITTDPDGWRGKASIGESDVVVFGDSFAFGHAADDRDFFANKSALRIKTVGSNGYSMVQALLWMERLAAELEGKLVVWFLYYANDLYDNLQPNLAQYRAPFVRRASDSEEWEIVASHVSPEPWRFPTERIYAEKLAQICSPTFLGERAWGACRFLLTRARAVCEGAGAELAVVGIPGKRQLSRKGRAGLAAYSSETDQFDADFTDRKAEEICRELGVPYVALTPRLTLADYKKMETHWNARGHRRVARVLEELYGSVRGSRRKAPAGRSTGRVAATEAGP